MDGTVIERVDLCFSLGKGPDNVDDADIAEIVSRLAHDAKEKNLKIVVGGGVSARSLSLVSSLHGKGELDFYETRKVGFSTVGFTPERYTRGLILALGFEIFFLKNKINSMQSTTERDLKRLGYLELNYWNDIRNILPSIE
jgi:hypothetical protein